MTHGSFGVEARGHRPSPNFYDSPKGGICVLLGGAFLVLVALSTPAL